MATKKPASASKRRGMQFYTRRSIVGSLFVLYGFILAITIMGIITAYHRLQITKLDLYQRSYGAVVLNYYANSINTIESMASNTNTVTNVQNDDVSELTESLANERIYSDQFDSLFIYDADGKMIAISTNSPVVYSGVTLDNYTSPPVREAVLTHKPQITNAFLARAGRNIIAFTSPIVADDGTYIGSLVGTSTLKSLPNRVPFLKNFQNLSSAIVDESGTVVVVNSLQPKSLQQIETNEPVLAKLANQDYALQRETNFMGQKVFAAATKLQVGDITTLRVVSYMPQKDYDGLNHGPVVKIAVLLVMIGVVNGFLLLIVGTRQPERGKK